LNLIRAARALRDLADALEASDPTSAPALAAAPLPDILTCKAASAVLTMHPKVIARMAQRRELPAFKIHRSWRFRRAELLQWVSSQREGH
jgi:excisionase family DNA binding protein